MRLGMIVATTVLAVANSTQAARPAKAQKVTSTPGRTQVAAPVPLVHRPAPDAIAEAQRLYDALEYDLVAPLASQALSDPNITLDQKLAAYQLQGSALAIVGDPVDAERPFLLLFTVRPDFSLPDDTPPKIKSVFAKVKGEFDAVRDAQEAQQRKELAATIDIVGSLPVEANGGRPLRFEFNVGDPRGVVRSVRVQYRKKGEPDFLSLPLRRNVRGAWVGVVPGEWTASDVAFTVEASLIVADQKGPLKRLGEPFATVAVSAGELARQLPVPVWGFGTAAGVTGAVTVAAAGVTILTRVQNADFRSKLDRATADNPADGRDIVAQQQLGESLNVAVVASWATAGVAAVVTGVLALFTNWSGEDLDLALLPTDTAPEQSTVAATVDAH